MKKANTRRGRMKTARTGGADGDHELKDKARFRGVGGKDRGRGDGQLLLVGPWESDGHKKGKKTRSGTGDRGQGLMI